MKITQLLKFVIMRDSKNQLLCLEAKRALTSEELIQERKEAKIHNFKTDFQTTK